MTETLAQKETVKLNNDLLQELEVIYQEYLERKGFPDAYCTKVSEEISESLGFRYREGNFKLDFPNGEGISEPTHAWCEDAKKTIIDLTAHQFNAYLNEKLSIGVQVIYPKNPFYKRYTAKSA